MERLRCDVGTVRPHNRAEVGVKGNLSEVLRISQRLEHSSPDSIREIKLPLGAVLEAKAETTITECLDVGYVDDFGHRLMLGERLDGLKRL